jgi:hypothetical protein
VEEVRLSILEILRTIAICGGALALLWIAIQASLIADYIRVYLDAHGIWLEDGAEELRTPVELLEHMEQAQRKKRPRS